MFEIKKAFSKGPLGDDLMVIDEERNVWLQRVSSLGMDPGATFKLVWRDRVIPFDVHPESKFDENGKEYIVRRLHSFGASAKAEIRGVKPYTFKDSEECRQAQLLAVEAVLAYGSHYDGFQRPDGFYRIEFEGRTYTKSDFWLP